MNAFVRAAAAACFIIAPACAKSSEESAGAASAVEASMPERGNGPPPADIVRKAQQKSSEAKGLPAGALRIEPAVILDATGFEAPMAAATVFLPQGWTSEGGVLWGQEFACVNGYNFNWAATAPDGSMSIALLPQDRWEWNNSGSGPTSPGCRIAPYANVRDYLQASVERLRPGARIIDFRERADLAQQFAKYNTSTPMPMGEARTWVEAGEVFVSYQENGRAMKAAVAAVVVFSLSRTDMGTGVLEAATGYAFPGFAVAAPEGRLNLPLSEAIRQSIVTNPQWEQRIAGHNTAIARTAIAENAKRARIIADSNAEIARIRDETWKVQQDSADRRFREFGEVIRGVETYNDPNAPGGQAELSNLYSNAWRLNDGSYVLTDDASFEPFRDLGLDGKKLEATP